MTIEGRRGGLLVIGEAELAEIAALRAFAAGTVVDAACAMAAAERDISSCREAMRAHCIELPVGYRVCLSHEFHPDAPPPCLCAHLSVGVDRPGLLPSPVAVDMILIAFGMKPHQQSDVAWVETISPTERAVNLLQRLPPQPDPR